MCAAKDVWMPQMCTVQQHETLAAEAERCAASSAALPIAQLDDLES